MKMKAENATGQLQSKESHQLLRSSKRQGPVRETISLVITFVTVARGHVMQYVKDPSILFPATAYKCIIA